MPSYLSPATKSADQLHSVIDRAIEAVPEARPQLERKKEFFAGFSEAIQDPAQYQEAVRGVEEFLQRVEDELVTHVGGEVGVEVFREKALLDHGNARLLRWGNVMT